MPASSNLHTGAEFNVDTAMKEVEIIRISPSRLFAKGKRYGHLWLLTGLPPEERNSPDALQSLREEFNDRYLSLNPGDKLVVGIEEIEGLGPCIVEEWDEEAPSRRMPGGSPQEKEEKRTNGKNRRRKWAFVLLLIILLTTVAGAAGYIRDLSRSSAEIKANLEHLRIVHREREEKMLRLADSLDRKISAPLLPDDYGVNVDIRLEKDEKDRIINTVYKRKMRECERILKRLDSKVMPTIVDDMSATFDTLYYLWRRIVDAEQDLRHDRDFMQLPEYDQMTAVDEVQGGYYIKIGVLAKKWIPLAWERYRARQQAAEQANEAKPTNEETNEK